MLVSSGNTYSVFLLCTARPARFFTGRHFIDVIITGPVMYSDWSDERLSIFYSLLLRQVSIRKLFHSLPVNIISNNQISIIREKAGEDMYGKRLTFTTDSRITGFFYLIIGI